MNFSEITFVLFIENAINTQKGVEICNRMVAPRIGSEHGLFQAVADANSG